MYFDVTVDVHTYLITGTSCIIDMAKYACNRYGISVYKSRVSSMRRQNSEAYESYSAGNTRNIHIHLQKEIIHTRLCKLPFIWIYNSTLERDKCNFTGSLARIEFANSHGLSIGKCIGLKMIYRSPRIHNNIWQIIAFVRCFGDILSGLLEHDKKV